MKKIILYITSIFLLTIITVSGTYAYFAASTGSQNDFTATSTQLKIIYNGGLPIEGPLNLSENKDGGLNTTVNIKLDKDSVKALANLYINIEQIDPDLATAGLKWEVYKTVNGINSYVNSGTFVNCQTETTTKKCATGDRLYIVNSYQLLTDETAFTVYVWLNGHEVGNEVIGKTFKGTVTAETENFTASLAK